MSTARTPSPILTAERRWALILLAPYIIGIVGLQCGPILATWLISFCRWDVVTAPTWIGLGNYQRLAEDAVFWKAMRNTLYYTAVSVPLGVSLSLALALLINRPLRGIWLFRTAYFLPVVTSTVAVALVWTWFYDTNYGMLNYLLDRAATLLGLGPIAPLPWLGSPKTAMLSIILMSVWKGLGYNMVIFLAALQNVPRELQEAAMLDGAGRWGQFRHVTLPVISPVLLFVVIVSLIGAFQVFDQMFIMTRDGRPANSTLTLVYHLYNHAFKYLEMGYASAIGVALFLLIAAVTALQWVARRHWVHEA